MTGWLYITPTTDQINKLNGHEILIGAGIMSLSVKKESADLFRVIQETLNEHSYADN